MVQDPSQEQRPDFKLLIAFAAMFLVVALYMMYMQPAPPSPQPKPESEAVESQLDTATATMADIGQQAITSDSISIPDTPDSGFVAETIMVKTPLFTAGFSTLGADLVEYSLNQYQYIVNGDTELPISLRRPDGGPALRFEFWGQPLKLWQRGFVADQSQITLQESDDSISLVFTWEYSPEYRITKAYVFYPDRYSFDVILSVPGNFPVPLEREYTFGWDSGVEPTEFPPKEDIENMAAVAMLGKDIEEVKDIDDDERPRRFGGTVRWAGVRTKYFLNAIIPRGSAPGEFIADRSIGITVADGEQFRVPYHSSRFAVPVTSRQAIDHRYTVFLGPLDYFIIKRYNVGFEDLIHLGWKIPIRPFAIFVLWAFRKLYEVIPNYGWVIILFGFLIKALFHPLTKKSMASMQRMKEMSPKLQKLKEKYKNDPQRLNRETMKLYKEAGFNPLSGCLPLLAQMPVFFALYQVLRNSIQMRGAEFIFHITDLSQKDSLYILPIIMTLSFFWQQKMTTTDPKQKALVYVMPLVFGFLFAQSPAGLTLYWTVYNVFSVIEQYVIKARRKDEPAAA